MAYRMGQSSLDPPVGAWGVHSGSRPSLNHHGPILPLLPTTGRTFAMSLIVHKVEERLELCNQTH